MSLIIKHLNFRYYGVSVHSGFIGAVNTWRAFTTCRDSNLSSGNSVLSLDAYLTACAVWISAQQRGRWHLVCRPWWQVLVCSLLVATAHMTDPPLRSWVQALALAG